MTAGSTPPVAARGEHRREHHGDVVDDPYEWLRDKDDPAVLAHLEAENTWSEARTAHLAPLREAIFEEIRSRVQETDVAVPVADGPWWYYSRTVEGQQYAVHCRAPRTEGDPVPVPADGHGLPGEVVLVDGNALAEGHDFFSLGGLVVSRDHGRLAYAVDLSGDERFDITVVDLTTGDVLDTAITGAGYGLAFSGDGEHLFHVEVDDAWRPHRVHRHRVGTDRAADVEVFHESDERFWMGLGSSRDERWVVLSLGSKDTSEVWLLDAEDPEAGFRCVAPRREGVEYEVEPHRDGLYVLHTADRPDGDLAWAPIDASGPEDWVPLLSSQPGQRFTGVDAFDAALVLSLRHDAVPALALLPTVTDRPIRDEEVRLVEVGDPLGSTGVADTPDPASPVVRVVHESWVSPRSVHDVDLTAGAATLLRRQPVRGDWDPERYVATREWVTADDGVQVPMSVVRRRDVLADGSAPGLLTGYGSYEISSDPYFSVARLSLLDRGVVFATAHVRGGGEMGRAWYEQGRLVAKPTTFSDFVACGRHLVDAGWVARDRLAAEGGSAGGLLIGAAVNLDPGLFRVVHAAVPFVDALTTILRPELPLTVGEWEEWGNPLEDAAVYAVMKGYTPYENVRPVEYPAILATTSLNDTRVFFTEPAKWVARLRETVTNDPVQRPILLRTEMEAGHGGRSGRYDAWRQLAWEWAFVLDQLGLSA